MPRLKKDCVGSKYHSSSLSMNIQTYETEAKIVQYIKQFHIWTEKKKIPKISWTDFRKIYLLKFKPGFFNTSLWKLDCRCPKWEFSHKFQKKLFTVRLLLSYTVNYLNSVHNLWNYIVLSAKYRCIGVQFGYIMPVTKARREDRNSPLFWIQKLRSYKIEPAETPQHHRFEGMINTTENYTRTTE